MSDAWMPGLLHDLGAFAGYVKGRNRMELVKVHATAKNGAGNVTIGKRGYFQFYVPKDGSAMQFAEADALCWDSAEFNDDGPGIEFEREGTGVFPRDGLQEFEPLTENQLGWGRLIFAWLASEWGVPLDLYDGPRYQATPHFRGFVNHGDLDAARSDGVTRAEWDALAGSVVNEEVDGMYVVYSVRQDANDANPELAVNSAIDGVLRHGNPYTVKGDGTARVHDIFAVISPEDMEAAFAPTAVEGELLEAGPITVDIDYGQLAAAVTAGIRAAVT